MSGRATSRSLPLALGGAIADSYAYHAGGRLATATTNGVASTTVFDEVGNLVGEEAAGLSTTLYAYDAANRLVSRALTPASDGAETVITYYGWDEENAWRTCQGPNAGPTQANSPVDLSYNAQGRMSTYANSDTSISASYTYDASGQRTKSVVTSGGTQATTTYDYDGLTLLSLAATQGTTTWRIDCLYDEEGALYGGVYRSPASSTSPTYFTAVTNDHGDVLALCDADGDAFAAYRYDAWGSPQGAGNLATGIWTQGTPLVTSALAGQIASRQILRYASYCYDEHSGLYYCSARYYDPATRQWTTGDPAKADGEESAYQYCGGEPVGRTDPRGTSYYGDVTRKTIVTGPTWNPWRTVRVKMVVHHLQLSQYHDNGAALRTWKKMRNATVSITKRKPNWRVLSVGVRWSAFSGAGLPRPPGQSEWNRPTKVRNVTHSVSTRSGSTIGQHRFWCPWKGRWFLTGTGSPGISHVQVRLMSVYAAHKYTGNVHHWRPRSSDEWTEIFM